MREFSISKVEQTISDWLRGELVNVEPTENGELVIKSVAQPTFTRDSIAYKSDGSQVAANQPRFDVIDGVMGLMVEEGTTNAIPHRSDGKFVYTDVVDRKGYTNDIVEWITDSSVPSPALHVKRITPYPANGGCAYATVGDLLVGQVMPGQKYTISLWFKGNKQSSSIVAQVRFNWRNSNNQIIGSTITLYIAFTDNWQRYVFTVTAPDGAYKIHNFQVGLGQINLNDTYEFYIAGLQLEQKPYATSWTVGTRQPEVITVPTAGVLNSSAFTIEMWIKQSIVTTSAFTHGAHFVRLTKKVMLDFDVAATVESLGKLDYLIETGVDNYEYVFIDEAHRFRNQDTESFKLLHQICFNKKVILISATPQNNYSRDIENQIYLFQPKHNSTIISNIKNLEAFFGRLEADLKKTEKGSAEYMECLRRNSEIIRDKVLRHIMIRRTRKEIIEYYSEDLKKQGLKFPELGMPEKIIYSFDDKIDDVFNKTIGIIKTLDYARYAPLTYLKDANKKYASMMVAQRNMSGFMKSILVKRLESSFYAFKMTLTRFINSYERFIQMCEQGDVYISKKVNVYDLLDNGDDDKLMELVDSERVQYFSINDFKPSFIPSLKRDLSLLKELKDDWETIKTDPKLEEFEKELKKNSILKDNKIIIFTESKETAEYIGRRLKELYPEKVAVFSSESSSYLKREIEKNFNPAIPVKEREDRINILITTDILAEGINLHRSNVIVNYDLPWNPTRIMQRVGRINRVGTEHDRIYVFNFFPTAQANAQVSLEENIMQKLQAFHDTLGEDFKYLSEDEQVTSHKLYNVLSGKENLEDEEGSNPELGYLNVIRKIRDYDQTLFEKIKRLPLKAKAARRFKSIQKNTTVTFIRKGSLKMFFMTDGDETREISFIDAISYIKADKDEPVLPVPQEYYKHLDCNKNAFDERLFLDDEIDTEKTRQSGNDAKMIKLLKAISKCKSFTDEQDEMLVRIRKLWEDGEIPQSLTKEILKSVEGISDPMQIYYEIYDRIPEKYLEDRKTRKNLLSGNKQVILSAFLYKGEVEV